MFALRNSSIRCPGCMSLVLGTERATTPEEKEGAGLFTSFALMMGLAAGSSAGLLLSQLV